MVSYSKKHLVLTGFLLCGLFSDSALSVGEDGYLAPADEGRGRVAAMLRNIEMDNEEFVTRHAGDGYFASFMDGQHPRMTLVCCSDSRLHTHAFDKTPDNDIFTVRNLSGQFGSGAAEILFGIAEAHTPLLLVMGHDDCGAVKTQTKFQRLIDDGLIEWNGEKYVVLPEKTVPAHVKELLDLNPTIQRALRNVRIAHGAIPPAPNEPDYSRMLEDFNRVVHRNVKFNTHCQVDECLKTFREKVTSGELIIAGALYDFQGRENKGQGRVNWIDARDTENEPQFSDVVVGAKADAKHGYVVHSSLPAALARLAALRSEYISTQEYVPFASSNTGAAAASSSAD